MSDHRKNGCGVSLSQSQQDALEIVNLTGGLKKFLS
jgi:hypothetical protein